VWLLAFSAALITAVITSSVVGSPRSSAVVTTIGLWAYAGVVVRLLTTSVFRPLDEPLMDAAVVLAALLIGAATASAVRVAGLRADVPLLELSVVFAAVVAAAIAWPAVLWLRRGFLQRRYGSGSLSHEDMVAVTADLHPQADPRELLGKAAMMIETATGCAQVQLIVGDDVVEPRPGWELYPLDVGRERVGVLLIDPGDPEGSEPHQERIVRRMLPAIALIARAVDLAVAAEQARQDVARQRDQERTRILSDLHDGVGPQLAGMSMRVQAQLRRDPTPLMRSLATGLASARGDLRRIVSGLTPSALHDTDLTGALVNLVESFDAADRRVLLETQVDPGIPDEVAVAVYRSVAEGVANSLRHGRAQTVKVRVVALQQHAISVDIFDDGMGGVIVEGVGLTSLRRRAEHLGGCLTIGPHQPSGVHLHLELPRAGVT
jgi:signal transduction histidine kinase